MAKQEFLRLPVNREGFITSRNFPLPANADEMVDQTWFNMWQRRLWPYQELQDGDALYWFDTTIQAIVWKSQVHSIERFEYANKDEARDRLQSGFGVTDFNEYFDAATDHGYCIAYKVDSLVRLNIPKPADYRFPQTGWLRCSDQDANDWLKVFSASSPPDGSAATELSNVAAQVTDRGYFSPGSLKDERKKRFREIVERRGQPAFRTKLIAAYGGRCAVTGCDAHAALEAAHIVPYSGAQSHHVTNGLLLRADIHTLFDLDLIGIHPKSLSITLAPAIRATAYLEFQARKLLLPTSAADVPNHDALAKRWKRFDAGTEQ